MIDWDAWRRDYDRFSYSEHVEFYRQVAEMYPDQQQFNEPAVRLFLADSLGPVLELGGWKGELAANVLPDFPLISMWLNVEIAPQAACETVCADARYTVVIPDTFIWDSDLDLEPYRTLIASHVIEHMKLADVDKLLDRVPNLERLYVDTPLHRLPPTWDGIESSHIIEVGWDGLDNLLIGQRGFEKVGELDGSWGPAYWFQR